MQYTGSSRFRKLAKQLTDTGRPPPSKVEKFLSVDASQIKTSKRPALPPVDYENLNRLLQKHKHAFPGNTLGLPASGITPSNR